MVPDFINQVPKEHFAGISVPCRNGLQEARNSAIADVVKQVLGAINGKYIYSYTSRVTGNPRSPIIHIQDDFTRIASGVVLDVERNIVRSSHYRDGSGRYTSFLLVKYSDSKIREMRRLSKGANIIVSVLSNSGGALKVKVSETNGVIVTLSLAEVTVHKKNRFAKMINFCIWKVPYGSKHSFSMALNPIKICSDVATIKLGFQQAKKDLEDYLLGAQLSYRVKIHGFDELGRTVSTSFEF